MTKFQDYSVIERLTSKWGLSDLKVVIQHPNNFVFKAQKGSGQVIVKLGFDKHSIAQERQALLYYDGRGCVRLIDYDDEHKALLLEYVSPGTSLKSLFPHNDEQAVLHASSVIKELHSHQLNDSSHFSRIEEQLIAITAVKSHVLPFHHLQKALTLAIVLLATTKTYVLLHGDLHHDNVLLGADNKWIAIDPKGVIGDPAFECGAFIRNPMPELLKQSNIEEIIARRIELFSEYLEINKNRIAQWAYVNAILSACWAIEDGQDWRQPLRIAEIIDGLNV